MKFNISKIRPEKLKFQRRTLLSAVILTSAVISAIFFTSIKAQQEGQGLRVTPVSFELTIEKGLTSRGIIHLDNFTGRTIQIGVHLENFSAQGEQGNVSLTNEDSPYSLAKWIKISPTVVTIKPNERKDFNFAIDVPAGAEPGGHFGSIVFSTIPSSKLNTTGATLIQSVGSLFLVTIPGPVTENATVESFTTGKSFYEFGPVDFTIRVKNNSSIHIKPIGVITIKNDITGTRSVVGVDGRNVLPGAIRQVPALWDNHFLFGKYTATANLNYGTKNFPLATSTSFIGFPVTYAVIVLIIIVILLLLRKRLWKAFKVIAKG